MKKTLPFIIITCLVSWLCACVLYLFDWKVMSLQYNLFGMFYMLIPAAVAILLQKVKYKEELRSSLSISFRINRWFFVAVLTPLVMVVLAIVVGALLPEVTFSASGDGMLSSYTSMLFPEAAGVQTGIMNVAVILLVILSGLLAACTVNALFALGEELGWRGYMLRHLSDWSCLKVAVFTGVIWGIWHFPLILKGHNYPTHPVIGVFMMIGFCVLLSPVMTYLVIKSKSVISAAVFHGSINAFAASPLLFLTGGSDLTVGLTGYSGFIAIAVINLLFFLFDRYITKERIFTRPVLDFVKYDLKK